MEALYLKMHDADYVKIGVIGTIHGDSQCHPCYMKFQFIHIYI